MRAFIFLAPLLLSGCSNYTFNSNVDKEIFDQYFKPSQVTVYDKAQLEKMNYIHLTTVEGSVCQQASNEPKPTLADARTQARLAAADAGANGIGLRHAPTGVWQRFTECSADAAHLLRRPWRTTSTYRRE